MPQATPDRLLVEALGIASLELNDLVRLADQLEIALAGMAARLCVMDAQLLADCQVADLLAQRLAGLAGFVAGLAAHAPPDARVDVSDAVRALTLGEQARRLAGPIAAVEPTRGGEAAFFTD
jgi:hypothetical protein